MFKTKAFYFIHNDGHAHVARLKSRKQALAIAKQYPDVFIVAEIKKAYPVNR